MGQRSLLPSGPRTKRSYRESTVEFASLDVVFNHVLNPGDGLIGHLMLGLNLRQDILRQLVRYLQKS